MRLSASLLLDTAGALLEVPAAKELGPDAAKAPLNCGAMPPGACPKAGAAADWPKLGAEPLVDC